MMNTRLINTLITACLVVLLASCARETREPLSQKMIDQIALLPQDANIIGYMNFQQVYQSPFFHFFADSARKNLFRSEEYQEFIESTNFDIEKDIHELYFAANTVEPKDTKGGLVMAIGHYDSEKIVNYISSKDKQKELIKKDYLNFELYQPEDEDKVFCFVNEEIFIAGIESQVKSCLDKSLKKPDEVEVTPALLDRIEQLKYKYCAWFTMDTEMLLEELEESDIPDKLQGLKSLKKLNFSFKVADKLKFFGECECSDSEKAELFQDAVKGFIATVKLSVSDDRESVDILNKVDVDTRRNRVEVKFQMTKAEIEKLIEKDYFFRKQPI